VRGSKTSFTRDIRLLRVHGHRGIIFEKARRGIDGPSHKSAKGLRDTAGIQSINTVAQHKKMLAKDLLFFWDGGIKLTNGLAVDFRRRQPQGFISHAHADHMARHELALCTAPTAALYQLRLGTRPVVELQYGVPKDWAGMRLTAFPAGHCLGSAMLHVEAGNCSLLYTGDFRLKRSFTAEPAQIPRADILIMESTYGQPHYRMPPREETVTRLFELVTRVLNAEMLPVIYAYSVGKAQEVTSALTKAGFSVWQHQQVYRVSQVYEQFGVTLGHYSLCNSELEMPAVLVVPPRASLPPLKFKLFRIAVTGWALDESTKYRLGVDEALPLTDHADYEELIQLVEQVAPDQIFCLHGPESFVHRLCEQGWQAKPLGQPVQNRLF